MIFKIFFELFFSRFHNKSSNNPIIIVPGIFGSLGKDIVPGTGRFGFGPANKVYKPLVDKLTNLGYEKNKNLFVAFYNWRNKNAYSAKQYLIPIIEKAKEACNSEKVDLICHSMGGLVARAYIQSSEYKFDVDKLIMLGTPNQGSAKAYSYWQGGILPYEDANENFIYRVLWKGYIWLLKIIYREMDDLKVLRRYCPSVKELLPSNDYGDFLFYDIDGQKIYKSIDNMIIKNEFLNSLNFNLDKLYNRKVKIYQILGYGFNTYDKICIEKENEKGIWIDGKPIYFEETESGDGTVTNRSSNIVNGKVKYLKKDHSDIVEHCDKILCEILGKKISKTSKLSINEESELYSIMITDVYEIDIMLNNNKFTLDEFEELYANNIEKIKSGNNIWILLDVKINDDVILIIKPLQNKISEIIKIDQKIKTLGFEDKIIKTKNIYKLKL